MPRVRAILFDLDGTLIDSGLDIAGSVNHVRRKLGYPALPEPVVAGYIGVGVQVLIERSLPEDPERHEEAVSLFRAHYFEHCLDRTALYPGVAEALREIRRESAERRLAVVTNKPVRPARRILEALGIAPLLDLTVGGDSGFGKKPDPAPLRAALASLGGVDPGLALMVGDGPNDIEAGRRAGTRTCAVTYGIGQADALLALEPDHVLDRVEDLRALLADLDGR